MQKNGFALVRDDDGVELDWWETIPPRVEVPGTSIAAFGVTSAWSFDGYHIEARAREFADPPPDPIIVPRSISRQRCAMQMCVMGLITAAEMVAMAQTAEPPALVEGLLANMPEPDQSFARASFAEGSYSRANQLLVQLMTGQTVPDGNGGTREATNDDIDQFFIAADAL
ncbi:hypothetical protein AFEL58S_02008 [Afipia felis]